MGAPLEQRVPPPAAAAAPPPGSPRLQMFRALAGKACWRHGGQRAGKARELEAQALSHRRPWQPARPSAGTFPSSPLAICSQNTLSEPHHHSGYNRASSWLGGSGGTVQKVLCERGNSLMNNRAGRRKSWRLQLLFLRRRCFLWTFYLWFLFCSPLFSFNVVSSSSRTAVTVPLPPRCPEAT